MLLSLIAIILSGTGGLEAASESSPNLSPFKIDPKWPQCVSPVTYDTYASNAPEYTQLFGTVVDIISVRTVKHVQQCSQHCSYEQDCRFIYLSSYEEGASCVMGRKLIPHAEQSAPCVTNDKDPVIYGISAPGETSGCLDQYDTLKDRQSALIYNQQYLVSEEEAQVWITRTIISTTSYPRDRTTRSGIPTGSPTPQSTPTITASSTSGPGHSSTLEASVSISTTSSSQRTTINDVIPEGGEANKTGTSDFTTLGQATIKTVGTSELGPETTSTTTWSSTTTSQPITTTTPGTYEYNGAKLTLSVQCPSNKCICPIGQYLMANTSTPPYTYYSGLAIRFNPDAKFVDGDTGSSMRIGSTPFSSIECRALDDSFNQDCGHPIVVNGLFGESTVICPKGLIKMDIVIGSDVITVTDNSLLRCYPGKDFLYQNKKVTVRRVYCS